MSKLTNFNNFNPTAHKNKVATKKRMVKENAETAFPTTEGVESSVLQNLWHISKKSMEIHDSIKNTEGEQIPEWILEIVASLNDRMNTVIDYMGYQTAMANGETGTMTDTSMDTSAIDLDQKEEADDLEDETEMSTPIAMLEAPEGSEDEESDSDEEESDEELEESVKYKYFENPMVLKPFKR